MRIALVPFGNKEIAEHVFFEIPNFLPFNFKLDFLDPLPIPDGSYNPYRGQYKSTAFIEVLKALAQLNNFSKVIGIASVDIYCKNALFVFGHAELNGVSAVVSVYRLNEDGKVIERTIKEVLHELGHLMGLKHCTNNCVMRFCENPEQIDGKSPHFCRSCLEKLQIKF
jgi:archaemetzincin